MRTEDMTDVQRAGLKTGQALAKLGAALALNSLAPTMVTWRQHADLVLTSLIATGEEFSSDDVAEQCGEPPVRNAMGGLFQTRRSEMRATGGFVQSVRKEAHARVIRTWIAR